MSVEKTFNMYKSFTSKAIFYSGVAGAEQWWERTASRSCLLQNVMRSGQLTASPMALRTSSPSRHLAAQVKSLCPRIGWESAVRWISISGASVQLLWGGKIKVDAVQETHRVGLNLQRVTFHVVTVCRSAFEETKQFCRSRKINNFLKAWSNIECELKT